MYSEWHWLWPIGLMFHVIGLDHEAQVLGLGHDGQVLGLQGQVLGLVQCV